MRASGIEPEHRNVIRKKVLVFLGGNRQYSPNKNSDRYHKSLRETCLFLKVVLQLETGCLCVINYFLSNFSILSIYPIDTPENYTFYSGLINPFSMASNDNNLYRLS